MEFFDGLGNLAAATCLPLQPIRLPMVLDLWAAFFAAWIGPNLHTTVAGHRDLITVISLRSLEGATHLRPATRNSAALAVFS
jgi:hypothetical protein